MNVKFLLLWLEAPLQSWGADSKFGRRDTLDFPTKSGIAGLLLCALGATGEQRELLAEIAPLRQTVIAYCQAQQELSTTPRVRDFHMVGSAYDEKDQWESLMIPKKSDGGKAVGGGVKLTYRYFIQNGKFAVVIEVPEHWADAFSAGLVNPVFDIYLGRKCCVPTDIVFRGSFPDENQALVAAAKIAEEKKIVENFRVVDGDESDETLLLNDVPLQFGAV